MQRPSSQQVLSATEQQMVYDESKQPIERTNQSSAYLYELERNSNERYFLPQPSLHGYRKTNDIERQNINVNKEYGEPIMQHMRNLEQQTLTNGCLNGHRITPALRARMIDWMIEVITLFKCDR